MNKSWNQEEYLDHGRVAENKFARHAQDFGWDVSFSDSEQDMNEHWDVKIERGDQRYRIDVKAMKKLNRSDRSAQDNFAWIELHGVGARNYGWLYSGKADYVAFETKTGFVIPKRRELVEYIYKTVNFNKVVSIPEAALYCVYGRKGREDKLTLVAMDDLRKLEQLSLR